MMMKLAYSVADSNIIVEKNDSTKDVYDESYVDDATFDNSGNTIGTLGRDTSWWNSSWSKRKPINIWVDSGSTSSNYQAKLHILYDNDMNNDFSDLRFIRDSDNTKLDYWIESKNDGSWADVWVEIADSITTTNQTLAWVYYGNPQASSESNGASTFLFFDDFSSWDIDKWDKTEPGSTSVSVSNGIIELTGDGSNRAEALGKTAISRPARFRIYCKVDSGFNYKQASVGGADDYSTDWQNAVYVSFTDTSTGRRLGAIASGQGSYSTPPIDHDDYHIRDITWLPGKIEYYEDDVYKGDHTNDIPSANLYAHLKSPKESGKKLYVDWIAVTNYVDPEPTYWIGKEESYSGGEIITLHPTDDAYIKQAYGTTNYGSESSLIIKPGYSGWKIRSVIKFNLSDLPPDATIISAKLRLYYYAIVKNDPVGRTWSIHRNTQDFNEGEVTWNNQPSHNPTPTDEIIVPSSFGWVEWNVTSDIEDFMTGTPNYGWKLKDKNEGDVNNGGQFYSKEYGTSKPELVIKYKESVDTDGDGWSDYDEINKYFTDPNDADTDNDGVIDSQDIDPLEDLLLSVKIRRIRALDPVDSGSEADFTVKVTIDGTTYSRDCPANDDDVSPNWVVDQYYYAWREAESWNRSYSGYIGVNFWIISNDANASNKRCTMPYYKPSAFDYVEWDFSVAQAGTYYFWVRGKNCDEATLLWNGEVISAGGSGGFTEHWGWTYFGSKYLSKNSGTLRIENTGAKSIKLDNILITNDPDHVPNGKGMEGSISSEIGKSGAYNVPDNVETIDIKIEVWDRDAVYDDHCDISGTEKDCEITYSFTNGTWWGDDYIGDANGYGHTSGEEDSSKGQLSDVGNEWNYMEILEEVSILVSKLDNVTTIKYPKQVTIENATKKIDIENSTRVVIVDGTIIIFDTDLPPGSIEMVNNSKEIVIMDDSNKSLTIKNPDNTIIASTLDDENDCEVWFEIYQNSYDSDGLTYWDEINIGTNPIDSDTDNDGYKDGKDFDPLNDSIGNTMTVDEFDPKYQSLKYGEIKDHADGYAETENLCGYINSSQKRIEVGIHAFITDSPGDGIPVARCWHHAIMASDCKIKLPSSGTVNVSLIFDRIKGWGTRLLEAFSFFEIYIQIYNSEGTLLWEEKVEHHDWSTGAGDYINWQNKIYTIPVYLGKNVNYSIGFMFYHNVSAQVMFGGYCECYSCLYDDYGWIKVNSVEVEMI